MDNHQIAPTPLCERFAPLLPVLDDQPAPPDVAAARAHLATCRYCQAQQQAYLQLETALRRNFGPTTTPRLRTEDIMAHLTDETKQPTPQRRSSRSARSVASSLVALAAVLVLALLTKAVLANHSPHFGAIAHPTATSQPAPTVPEEAGLASVSMDATNDGWAVGAHCPWPCGPANRPVLYHDVNGTWTNVDISRIFSQNELAGGVSLNGIQMLSPTDGWVVGGGDGAVVLHFDGTQWTHVLVNFPGQLTEISLADAQNGWAISGDNNAVLHYDGNTWQSQPLPAIVSWPQAIYTVSPTEAWIAAISLDGGQATGNSYNGVMVHYLHGTWQVQQVLNNAQFSSISMDAPDDGWATGATASTSGAVVSLSSALWHYHHGTWQQVADPIAKGNNADLQANANEVSMRSPTDGWLIGDVINLVNPPTTTDTLIYHYDGQQWTRQTTPALRGLSEDFLNSIVFVNAQEAWVVGKDTIPNEGQFIGNDSYAVLILHYLNGTWTVVQQ